MKYRADIDGLRAIAVVPVILFHAGLEAFSGGFVGVDIFFVISGYLITTIIVREIGDGAFSLARFYERRARRILPALFVVIFACLTFALYNLLPNPFVDFAESILAVSVFSSNFLFWSESGYFDTATELKPLLHTWSLAVEEQYYVVFPLLVIGLWRFGQRVLIALLCAIAIVSLLAAQYYSQEAPTANFYLLTTRAWEILVGAFCAFYLNTFALNKTRWNQSAALLGLGLVIVSIFLFNDHTPFPSFWTLLPTLGVAMIILFASPETFVAKLLSKPILVGIGLVSYSAYLWHQPILAFVKMRTLDELPPMTILGVVALTFGLAYLTFRFVERPFRQSGVSRRALLMSIGAALIVCNGAAWNIIHNEGYPERLDAIYSAESRAKEADLVQSFTNDTKGDLPVILIVGDSYVTRWSIGLSSLIDTSKYRIVSVSYLGCEVAPLENGGFDVELLISGYSAYCTPFDTLLNDPEVMGAVEHVFWASHRPFSYASNLFRFDFINSLMQQVAPAKLHVIGEYHQMKYPENPSCINAMFVTKRNASVCLDMAVYPPKNVSYKEQKFYDRLTAEYDYFDPIAFMCRDETCPYEADGIPFMEDWNHLTASFLVTYLPDAVANNPGYFQATGLSEVFSKVER